MRAPRSFSFGVWAPFALAAVCAALVANPAARRAVDARLNDPAGLPTLARDSRIHYQPAVIGCAREVAAVLPGAMERVQSRQGRPFVRQPIVGVYASFGDYARANGLGDAGVAATARDGRIMLSPTLCGEERDRLAGVLAHELSHNHLFGWRGARGGPLPSWFSEGLAVLVSDGGAAEGLSDDEARNALCEGYAIVVDDDGLWRSFADIRFEREPTKRESDADIVTTRQRLAFRQAALFVAWLRDGAPEAFAGLLNRLEDGEAFAAAFQMSYSASVVDQWRRFRPRHSRPPLGSAGAAK